MDELTVVTWRVPHVNADALEGATVPEKDRIPRLRALRDAAGATELVYVPTCQRIVLALLGAPEDAPARILGWYGELGRSLPEPEVFRGRRAFGHLAEVASSLDSLVVGEPQVLGQFKEAARTCDAEALSGPGLRHVMGLVFRAAKAVRSDTDLFRGKVSLVPLTEGLLRDHLRDRADPRVAVLGTGQIGLRMVDLVRRLHPRAEVHLVSRDGTRAKEAAAKAGATPWALGDFLEAGPHELDVLACATRAEAPLVDGAHLARWAASRPLLALDLAVPRNTHAPAAPVPGLTLVQIDDLTRMSLEGRAHRSREQDAAHAVLDRELERIGREYGERRLAHHLARLATGFEATGEAHWAQAPPGVDRTDPAVRKWFEQMVRALLHEATDTVKEAGCPPE